MIKDLDPRAILQRPEAYVAFARAVGTEKARERYVAEVLKVREGERILDIGCGPGYWLDYFPRVDYVGFDLSAPYIEYARNRYGDRAAFFASALNADVAASLEPFDLIVANGVVHHLNDAEAELLFAVGRSSLKPGGRMVTVDGAFVEGQSPIARLIIRNDRGEHVRKPKDYSELAKRSFATVHCEVRHDLLRIPYTHCILECIAD